MKVHASLKAKDATFETFGIVVAESRHGEFDEGRMKRGWSSKSQILDLTVERAYCTPNRSSLKSLWSSRRKCAAAW